MYRVHSYTAAHLLLAADSDLGLGHTDLGQGLFWGRLQSGIGKADILPGHVAVCLFICCLFVTMVYNGNHGDHGLGLSH